MNRIQRLIIKKLLFAHSLRYTQMKPKNIEGNLFTYHLKKLMDEGLIQKVKKQYSLSAKGKLYVDRLSMKDLLPRIQPKIVTMLVIQNEKGEHLVYKRRREPFMGHIGFPHGKIHLGESVFAAAHRELKEKTGFDTELTHRGEVYATVFEGGELVTHIFSHIFSGVVSGKELLKTDQITKCFWSKIEDPTNPKYLPAFGDIFMLCHKPSEWFFEEYTYRF